MENNRAEEFEHFWNGGNAVNTEYASAHATGLPEISLHAKVGTPSFMNDGQLFLKVMEEIYEEIKRRSTLLSRKYGRES